MTAQIWSVEDGDFDFETYCPRHGMVYQGDNGAAAAETADAHDDCRVLRPVRAAAEGWGATNG